jgi:hypothetical protein
MYLVEKEDLIDEDDEFWGKEGKLTEMFKVSPKSDNKFTKIKSKTLTITEEDLSLFILGMIGRSK